MKKLQELARRNWQRATAVAMTAAPALAMATPTGPDFSSLTDAVDFTTVGVAILAIGAIKAAPLVVTWGTRKVLSMIGR